MLARNDGGIMSSRAKSRDPFFFVLHSLKMTIRVVSKNIEKDFFRLLTSDHWLLITKGFLDSSLRSSLGMTVGGGVKKMEKRILFRLLVPDCQRKGFLDSLRSLGMTGSRNCLIIQLSNCKLFDFFLYSLSFYFCHSYLLS